MGRRESYVVTPLGSSSPEKPRPMSDSSSLATVSIGGDGAVKKAEALGDFAGHAHGISWIVAAIFIIGDMVGGGLVSLPLAMIDTGAFLALGLCGVYAGVFVTFLGAVTSGYTGVQLGVNWVMLQNRWHEYRTACRKPYPAMAYRAIGTGAMHFTSACIIATQFSISVVFLLLASKNISLLLVAFFDVHFSSCILTLCVALAVLPLIMLESPKDFWQIAVGAMASTSFAVILILINTFHDAEKCAPAADFPPVEAKKFFLAYGTIIFAYGGHAAFPTIQHDMKNPAQFGRAVTVAYIIIFCLYAPVCIACYVVYGGSITDTIVTSLQIGWIQKTVTILITLHVFLTIVIVYSPLSQGVEDFVGIQRRFGAPRIALRASLMALSTFVALSMPNFGVVLDLVGGSTITMMTMLLPSIFYLFLVAGERKRQYLLESGQLSADAEDDIRAGIVDVFKYNNKLLLLGNILVLLFGFTGGVVATYSAIDSLVSTNFIAPCYVLVFQDKLPQENGGSVSCCGVYRNITTIDGAGFNFCSTIS